jgi:hypothetical protein
MGMKRTIVLGLFCVALVDLSGCDLPDKSIGDDGITGDTADTVDTHEADTADAGDDSDTGDATDTADPDGGCYGDQDCPDGLVCNAAEVCLPPPGCDTGPDISCPAVCYGECIEPEEAATCEMLEADYTAEMAEARACTSAEECGQTVSWGSCGCTRAAVIRLDHDIAELDALWNTGSEMGCPFTQVGGTCDCPEADGFACIDDRCTWNYL